MKFLNQNISPSKLTLMTAASVILMLQANAQQPDLRDQASSGRRGNADIQVWVGVDVLPGGISGRGAATNFPAGAQDGNSAFAGIWTTEALPGLVLTLQLDGDFALSMPADQERRCSAGVERGKWLASTDTNELLFHIQTDTNGRCGLSDLDAMLAIIKAEPGLTLIIDDSAAGEQAIPLIRTDP